MDIRDITLALQRRDEKSIDVVVSTILSVFDACGVDLEIVECYREPNESNVIFMDSQWLGIVNNIIDVTQGILHGIRRREEDAYNQFVDSISETSNSTELK
jgi:hypothetical protein